MKKNLLSGLILLLPLTITIAVIIFIVDLLTTPFLGNMESFLHFLASNFSFDIEYHTTALVFISRIFILILLFIFVLLLGFLGKRLFFNWLVKTMHAIMLRIPLINSIYKICRDIIEAIFSEKKKIFSRVVTVPFPSSDSKAIGLVTGNAPSEAQHADLSDSPQEILKTVFVATSPHPISGFLLLTEEKYLNSLDLSIEDAFKFLISCGIFTPTHQNDDPGDNSDGNKETAKDHILPSE